MASVTSVSRPHKDFSHIAQNGLRALSLAKTYKNEIEPRLPSGCVAQLESDLTSLGVVVPAAQTAKHVQVASTSTQHEALAQGYALVQAIRKAVVRRNASADVKKAYGVGRKMSPKVVKDVVSAIGLIVSEAGKDVAAAGALGILPSDITLLQEAAVAITKADKVQEQSRNDSPMTTKLRNTTGRNVMAAVDTIVAAGLIQFALNPAIRAEFEALIGKGNANRGAKKEEDEKEEGGEEK